MMSGQVNSAEETTPAPQPTDDDTLADSLVADDKTEAVAETPAEEVAEEVPAEETPAEETSPEPETAAEAPTAEEPAEPEAPADQQQPKPGTPDKALQQLQQRLSSFERNQEQLLKLIEQQGKATPQQAQQVASLQAKAEEVADEIALLANASPETVDGFDGTIKVAKRVVKHDQRLTTLEERVQQAEARAAQAEEAATWIKVEAKYPGVDVRSTWEQALQRAQTLGYEGKALTTRANEFFHETAAAAVAKPGTPAAKSPATPVPQPKAPVKPATTTARKAPPVSPGGATVTPKSGGAIKRPASETEEERLDRLSDELYSR